MGKKKKIVTHPSLKKGRVRNGRKKKRQEKKSPEATHDIRKRKVATSYGGVFGPTVKETHQNREHRWREIRKNPRIIGAIKEAENKEAVENGSPRDRHVTRRPSSESTQRTSISRLI